MYQDFFGLREMPFNITPDPRFLFLTESHRDAIDSLIFGILHRKGFIELVGEVGCGKTTVCRAALRQVADRTQTALILNPTISETQLIRAILSDLGCAPKGNQRLALIEQLNEFLLNRAQQGVNVAVIIDEAQTLSSSMMEQIRLLSNLETDQHKLMQIVLAGQPELDRRLAEPGLRQLRHRVMVRAELLPLGRDDTARYIAHRLGVAEAPADVRFDDRAADMVHSRSGGIPRLINKICDRAMLSAYSRGCRAVDGDDAARAVAELERML
jgi:general secretion pathway protein A